MGQIEREIDKLDGACQVLCERLGPVKRQCPPTTGNTKDAAELSCELARWMREQAGKIRSIRETIEGQLELLEI